MLSTQLALSKGSASAAGAADRDYDCALDLRDKATGLTPMGRLANHRRGQGRGGQLGGP